MAKINENVAEQLTGRKAPHRFPVLDSTASDQAETHRIIREDVRLNRIRYEFPSGLNKLDLFEECRALTKLDDFDTMYDLTMQMLADKDLVIKLQLEDGSFKQMCAIHVTDKFQNMRGDDFIDRYPVVITWLTQFMADALLKKYPLPGSDQDQPQTKAAKKKA